MITIFGEKFKVVRYRIETYTDLNGTRLFHIVDVLTGQKFRPLWLGNTLSINDETIRYGFKYVNALNRDFGYYMKLLCEYCDPYEYMNLSLPKFEEIDIREATTYADLPF